MQPFFNIWLWIRSENAINNNVDLPVRVPLNQFSRKNIFESNEQVHGNHRFITMSAIDEFEKDTTGIPAP